MLVVAPMKMSVSISRVLTSEFKLGLKEGAVAVFADDYITRLWRELWHDGGVPGIANEDAARRAIGGGDRLPT